MTSTDFALDRAMAVVADASQPDRFIGAPRDYRVIGVYGGHLLGQGLAAGFETISDDWYAHSLHAYFAKAGTPGKPFVYDVERMRDGKRFSLRQIRATQDGELKFTMTVSFKHETPGDEHEAQMPALPTPEEIAQQRERLGVPEITTPFTLEYGIDLEIVDLWSPAKMERSSDNISTWMKATLSPDATHRQRQIALAYLSDGTIMFNALRPHGNIGATHFSTSLDHAVWFHRDADPTDWLLFDQCSPAAADGRGFNRGVIYNQAGQTMITVAQESLLQRLPSSGE